MDNNALVPGAGGNQADTSNTGEPSAEDAAEDAEWDLALKDYAPGRVETTTTTTTEVPDEQTDTATTTTTIAPEETSTTTTTTTIDPNETPEAKAERERIAAELAAKGGNGAGDEDEENAPDQSRRTARQTAREAAREVETVAAEVRKEMFADVPERLTDKDGDPIDTIPLVMEHINPNTGVGFTEEEAATWLLFNQREFNEKAVERDKEITRIAEVYVDIKDQTASIEYQYGELLKSMPEVRDQLWTEYQKTFVKDPKTGIITNAPVSMESFYEVSLQPYVKLAESLEAQEAAKAEADKAQKDAQKVRNRGDRADIFGRGDTEELDDEDKEWDAAHKSYFGQR